jgi:ketol-acid reductoisomerase
MIRVDTNLEEKILVPKKYGDTVRVALSNGRGVPDLVGKQMRGGATVYEDIQTMLRIWIVL